MYSYNRDLSIYVLTHAAVGSYNILFFPTVLSVKVSFQKMVTRANGMFKIICTSTGGRPLTMSVTGPSGVVEDMMNIVVEGNMEGMGNDTFSAEVTRQDGKHGDLYICNASNGVSEISSNGSILKGLSLCHFEYDIQ